MKGAHLEQLLPAFVDHLIPKENRLSTARGAKEQYANAVFKLNLCF